MKKILILFTCFCVLTACQQKANSEAEAKRVVEQFFDAFNNHKFDSIAEITTEDWTHINPFGGWKKDREAVMKELNEVHSTFLKGITMTIEEMNVRPTGDNSAVVTVTNSISTYVTPDGVKHENERQIKTFVIVRRDGKWRIMQDQNTIIK